MLPINQLPSRQGQAQSPTIPEVIKTEEIRKGIQIERMQSRMYQAAISHQRAKEIHEIQRIGIPTIDEEETEGMMKGIVES